MTDHEIDCLIHEKIMGNMCKEVAVIYYANGRTAHGYSTEYANQKSENYNRQGIKNEVRMEKESPYFYSTKIDDAWSVVDAMQGRGYIMNLSGHRYGIYRAMFADSKDACSKNAARAICLAALSAVGVKVEAASEK